METMFIAILIYLFVLFYRDALKEARTCSTKLTICELEQENLNLLFHR